MKVTGIDISRLMINFASTQATREGLRNAKFEVMNALEPLEFPDNTFDLVNMRFAVGYILRKDWPRVMRECFRITAPGGSLRLTETDHSGITNSAAFTKVNNLLCGMTHKAGYGFSEDGSTFCLTPMFEQLLTEAGFTNVKYRPYIIDISYGKPMLAAHWRNMRTIFVNSGILLEKLKLGTREEVERIHAAAEEAISQESFRGLVYVLNAWGQKPFLA